MMDEFTSGAIKAGLRRMFAPGGYFSICTVRDCLDAADIPRPPGLKELEPLHCVHWGEMEPAFRAQVVERVLALFDNPAFTIGDVAPQLAPGQAGVHRPDARQGEGRMTDTHITWWDEISEWGQPPPCEHCGAEMEGAQTLLQPEDLVVCDDCLPSYRPEEGGGMSEHAPGPVSRFALYRGQWIVMQANIDAEDQRAVREWSEEASVYVPNVVAATAMDLLSACRKVIADEEWGYPHDGNIMDGTLEMLRAAIAKAEGRTP